MVTKDFLRLGAARATALAMVAAASAAFAGCDLFGLNEEPEAPAAEVVVEKVYDGTKASKTYDYLYIDLESPDAPASDGAGAAWDVMITGQREILTNSGVTAAGLSSGGLGGAVFSGKTDMATAITIAEAKALFAASADDGKDYAYWDKAKSGSSAPTSAATGNAVSFPGYKTQGGRDGKSSASAWVFGDVGAHVDVDFSLGAAYASWERMTPSFSAYTNNVYIVRSGDGQGYYKLQVPEVVYQASSASSDGKTHYTFKLKFVKLQ